MALLLSQRLNALYRVFLLLCIIHLASLDLNLRGDGPVMKYNRCYDDSKNANLRQNYVPQISV